MRLHLLACSLVLVGLFNHGSTEDSVSDLLLRGETEIYLSAQKQYQSLFHWDNHYPEFQQENRIGDFCNNVNVSFCIH